MTKEEFYNEFKDWTKEEMLSRAYDICLKNIELEEAQKNFEKQFIKEMDYKSRKEKAVEYINCNKQKTICAYGDNEDDDFEICLWEEDIDNLLNILNGKE